jgi:hypothetical protein
MELVLSPCNVLGHVLGQFEAVLQAVRDALDAVVAAHFRRVAQRQGSLALFAHATNGAANSAEVASGARAKDGAESIAAGAEYR